MNYQFDVHCLTEIDVQLVILCSVSQNATNY